MSKVIGITGTIGSGKSTAGQILVELGIPVIDTDHIVHELLSKDPNVIKKIFQRFGTKISKSSKSAESEIDRSKLGQIVFQDAKARKDLEGIVHPAVRAECRRMTAELASSHPVVAILVPLLFESGIEKEFDEIWTVATDAPTLRQRLKQRDGFTDAQIDSRLAAQWSQTDKSLRSNKTIDNSGERNETRRQIEVILKARQ